MSKQLIQPIRGTRDLLSSELQYHNHILDIAKKSAQKFCYEELATPIFEKSEIFHRSLGESSDVVSKETYSFTDRDKSSITLRPEFTAAIVRSFISNGLTQNLPAKFFSHGPVFRHERPQKCRYRQFHQINFEYFGAYTAFSDAETISLAFDILSQLGLSKDITLELNSLGDKESRQNYNATLVEYFSKYKNDLSEDSKERLIKNPLRILDSKDEGDKKIIQGAPKISDCFNEESKQYFYTLQDSLNQLGLEFKVSENLVRGLDYYTHTVFEFTTDALGSQGTVLAGGRYDSLVELMGGPETKAIGFAAGIERLAELLRHKVTLKDNTVDIYIIPMNQEVFSASNILAQQLRLENTSVLVDYKNNVRKSMKKANNIGAKFIVIYGTDEVHSGIVKIKNMKDGNEMKLPVDQITNHIIQQ